MTEIKFRNIFDSGKYSFYCNMKGKTPYKQKHHAIYQVTCPGCHGKYVGKMERLLLLRMNEHGALIFKHLFEYELCKEYCTCDALLSAGNNLMA